MVDLPDKLPDLPTQIMWKLKRGVSTGWTPGGLRDALHYSEAEIEAALKKLLKEKRVEFRFGCYYWNR